MRHSPSGKRHINRLGKFAGSDAITGKHLAARNYVELRALHLLLDISIRNTRDFRYLFLYLFAGGEQPVESEPNNFIAYLSLGSRGMASMRWEIGCPISILTPGGLHINFGRKAHHLSAATARQLVGASISDTFTVNAHQVRLAWFCVQR